MIREIAQVASERARMWDNGWRPVAVYGVEDGLRLGHAQPGKQPWGPAWQLHALEDPPAAVAQKPRRDALNTGILCDGLRALDFDIDDPDAAFRCVQLAREMFGEAPTRWRNNSPRRLILLRAAEGTPQKRTLVGSAGKIEVLGRGQQFVAFGDHVSGAELQWDGDGPDATPLEDIPAVTEDQITAYLARCAAVIGATPPGLNGASVHHDHDAGEPQADLLRIATALNAIPNDGPPDWERWNRVGMAIWRGVGGAAAGWPLFDAWSQRNEAYDVTETRERWMHYRKSPPTEIGAGTLFHLARQAAPPPPAIEEAWDEDVVADTTRPLLDPWEEIPTLDFPLEVLPPRLQTYVRSLSVTLGADVNACALAALAACSAAIPQYVMLAVRDGFVVRPRLWAMLCGSPSLLKTPIINAVSRPLATRDRRNTRAYQQALEAYEDQPKAERRGREPPKPTRQLLRDITTERHGQVLSNQGARGCPVCVSELAGFIGQFDRHQTSAAHSRAYWLMAYDGGEYSVDRISRASDFIDEMSTPIIGGVQLDRLTEMTDLTTDGMLQRFLVVMMRDGGDPGDYGDGGRARRAFEELLEWLMDLSRPAQPLRLSLDARDRFDAIEREVRALTREDLGASQISFVGKLTGLTASLALILHLAEDPGATPDIVCAGSVDAAWTILRGWAFSHACALYHKTTDQRDVEKMQRICSYVLTTKLDRLRPSDFTNHSSLQLAGLNFWEMIRELSVLVACGWLDEERDDSGQVRAWLVPPDLRQRFAARRDAEIGRKARKAAILDTLRAPRP